MVEAEMKLSPAEQRLRMDSKDAAWPLVVSMAPTPPSSAAIFFSTASQVGLAKREYMNSVGISNSWAMCSVESKQ